MAYPSMLDSVRFEYYPVEVLSTGYDILDRFDVIALHSHVHYLLLDSIDVPNHSTLLLLRQNLRTLNLHSLNKQEYFLVRCRETPVEE